LQVVNGIINGKTAITAQTAKEIAAALGTSTDLWMNLQGAYDLFIQPDADPAIRKRAQRVA
jgi:HTH-type transcriptional regulator/antitoxin HigA